MDKIAYLGPEGTYSYIAAVSFLKNCEPCACPSFSSVVSAVAGGECDYGVLPIENSLSGGISGNMDLLGETKGVLAVEEKFVPIDHRFVTFVGADISKITRIFSHTQALQQCARYLEKNFPKANLIPVVSTAAGLENMSCPTDACIGGAHLMRDGLQVGGENIADEKNNQTRFLLIKKGEADERRHIRKIYFCARCKHRPGALYDMIDPLRKSGLNMTGIQSRPIKKEVGEYKFFVELDGDYSDEKTRLALKEVADATDGFKILGLY